MQSYIKGTPYRGRGLFFVYCLLFLVYCLISVKSVYNQCNGNVRAELNPLNQCNPWSEKFIVLLFTSLVSNKNGRVN